MPAFLSVLKTVVSWQSVIIGQSEKTHEKFFSEYKMIYGIKNIKLLNDYYKFNNSYFIYGCIASRVLNLLNGLFAQFDFETMPVNMVKLINWLGKESFLYVTWVSANLLK